MSIRNLNILSKPGSIAVIGGKWPVWLARRLCQAVTEPLACGALCELMRRVIDKAGNAAFYSRNAAFAHCWAELVENESMLRRRELFHSKQSAEPMS